MDGEWFRSRHRLRGVSQAEAARRMGKADTFFTRVYSGVQELKLQEAGQLARILEVPLSEVLARAGLSVRPDDAVAPAAPGPGAVGEAEQHPADRPGFFGLKPQGEQQVFRLRSDALRWIGYRAGDWLLVDPQLRPRKGDVVLARVIDWRQGDDAVVVRVWAPPFLLRPGPDAEAPLTVDGERVVIAGVVEASYRERLAA
jgi:hypothetical protein